MRVFRVYRGRTTMALLALFPLIMIGTVLAVALSIHDEGYAWDGTAGGNN